MGAFFGEVALVLSRPRTASVRAASTVSSATPSPAHGGSRILRTWGCSDPSVATRGAQTHIPEYIIYVGQCTTVRAEMWVGVAVHDMTAQVEVYRLSKLDFELTLRQHPRIRQQVRARSPAHQCSDILYLADTRHRGARSTVIYYACTTDNAVE